MPARLLFGTVIMANANTVGGSAGALSVQLASVGFDVGDPVNASSDASDPPFRETVVYAAPGSVCEAERVAEVIGVPGVDNLPDPPSDESRDGGGPYPSVPFTRTGSDASASSNCAVPHCRLNSTRGEQPRLG